MDRNLNEEQLPETEDIKENFNLDKVSEIKTEDSIKQSSVANTKKEKKLVMLVSDTKYEVVKYVGKKIFFFRLTSNENADWDLCWKDNGVGAEVFTKMKPYQKINHFPGMFALARKNNLARNLMRIRKVFPKDYNFFPKTWLLPSEFSDLLADSKKKSNITYIVKPEASCQGKGIFLTKKIEEIKTQEHFVVQKYMENPLLIEGLKFDLRIYVLLYGCNPMRIFIYNEGLSRFCTDKYEKPNHQNMKNPYAHLTNYAINKNSSKFVFNTQETDSTTGHKRNLDCIFKFVDDHGGNSAKLKCKIEDAIIKTICSVQPSLAQLYSSCQEDLDGGCCFEVLGFDFLINSKFKPFLLEINHTPSFTTDTPFDWKVKEDLITDTIRLLNITTRKKSKYMKVIKNEIEKRMFKVKKVKTTNEDKAMLKEKFFQQRVKYENKNLGGYKLIYPSETSSKYDCYISEAKAIFDSFARNQKPQNVINTTLNQPPQANKTNSKVRKGNSSTSTDNRKLQRNIDAKISNGIEDKVPNNPLYNSKIDKTTTKLIQSRKKILQSNRISNFPIMSNQNQVVNHNIEPPVPISVQENNLEDKGFEAKRTISTGKLNKILFKFEKKERKLQSYHLEPNNIVFMGSNQNSGPVFGDNYLK